MDQMYGKIKKGNTVLIDNISILIDSETDQISRLQGWHGSFISPTFIDIMPGGTFQLFLDDGRSGKIIITNMEMSNSTKQVFYFTGNGPLSYKN